MKPLTSRNHTFDAVRILAAGTVMMTHADGVLLPAAAHIFHSALVVDGFFQMSGFLLCQKYDSAIQKGAGPGELMVARIIRIAPIYWLAMAVGIALQIFAQRHSLNIWKYVAQLSSEIFLIPSVADTAVSPLFPANYPTWTLMWEIILNIVFLTCWKSLRNASLAAVIALGAAGVIIGISLHGSANFGSSWDLALAGGGRAAFSFFLGVFLSRLYRASRWRPIIPGLILILIFAGTLAMPTTAQWTGPYDAFIIMVILPLFIWFAASSKMPKITTGICVVLGDLYYGIYAWHVPIIECYQHLMTALHFKPSLVVAVSAVVITCLWAWAVNHLYDRPVRAILTAALRKGDIYRGGAELALPPRS